MQNRQASNSQSPQRVKTLSEAQAKQKSGSKPVALSGTTLSGTTLSGTNSSQISRKFSIAVCLLVLLSMCVFWLISNYNTQNLLRQQADSLGKTLAQQTAMQLTELVLANDLISMNVILAGLVRDSTIVEVAVLNVSNELIAEARSSRQRASTIVPLPVSIGSLQSDYLAPISLANSVAGYVRIKLDLSYIEVAVVNNLLFIIAATILLLIVATTLTTTYFQYLVSFPANLLAFAIGNIREGKIETCPEPDNSNEISLAIRQFNATAEFLAQNTFLDNFGRGQPEFDVQAVKFVPGTQDVTLLCVKLSNFQYLASTLNETLMVNLLNKYYFFVGKVSQLYNGTVNYCSDGELVINFSSVQIEEEQAFYAICAGQLFLQLLGDLADVNEEKVAVKFRLSVHSGQTVSGLYSPITQNTNNITGRTLDLTRQICDECPNNSLLISNPAFQHAGAGTRIEAGEYTQIDDDGTSIQIYLAHAPMADYRLLLERQAIQLVTLYSD